MDRMNAAAAAAWDNYKLVSEIVWYLLLHRLTLLSSFWKLNYVADCRLWTCQSFRNSWCQFSVTSLYFHHHSVVQQWRNTHTPSYRARQIS